MHGHICLLPACFPVCSITHHQHESSLEMKPTLKTQQNRRVPAAPAPAPPLLLTVCSQQHRGPVAGQWPPRGDPHAVSEAAQPVALRHIPARLRVWRCVGWLGRLPYGDVEVAEGDVEGGPPLCAVVVAAVKHHVASGAHLFGGTSNRTSRSRRGQGREDGRCRLCVCVYEQSTQAYKRFCYGWW